MSVRTPAFPKEGIAQTYIQFEGNPIYGAPQTTNFQFNLMLKASAGDKEPDYDPPKGKPHLFEKANTHHYSAKEGQIFIPYHPSVDGPLTKRLLEEVVQRPGYQKMKFTQLMVAFVVDVSLVEQLLWDDHNPLQRDSSESRLSLQLKECRCIDRVSNATNVVSFDLSPEANLPKLAQKLRRGIILIGDVKENSFCMVVHRHISEKNVQATIEGFKKVLVL